LKTLEIFISIGAMFVNCETLFVLDNVQSIFGKIYNLS